MPRFAIAYEFLDDAGAADRRASLRREIARCARVWDAADAVALVETAEPLPALEERLYLDSRLNAVKDRLLVIELGDGGGAAARGAHADRDGPRALLPGLTIA